jgi:hypothetical protein
MRGTSVIFAVLILTGSNSIALAETGGSAGGRLAETAGTSTNAGMSVAAGVSRDRNARPASRLKLEMSVMTTANMGTAGSVYMPSRGELVTEHRK